MDGEKPSDDLGMRWRGTYWQFSSANVARDIV
jgi:hypothetical protein